jgi:hypothetical protein
MSNEKTRWDFRADLTMRTWVFGVGLAYYGRKDYCEMRIGLGPLVLNLCRLFVSERNPDD